MYTIWNHAQEVTAMTISSIATEWVPEGQTDNGKYNLEVLRKKKSWIPHRDNALAVKQFIPAPEHTGFSPLLTFPCVERKSFSVCL
jgi:hypothetical protein